MNEYTYHVTIQHPDGDTTVFAQAGQDEMVELVKMATIDPTLSVQVQRDDLPVHEVARLAQIKDELTAVFPDTGLSFDSEIEASFEGDGSGPDDPFGDDDETTCNTCGVDVGYQAKPECDDCRHERLREYYDSDFDGYGSEGTTWKLS